MVLRVVDKHVQEARPATRADVRVLAEQRVRTGNELAVVDQALLGEDPLVLAVERGELALAVAAVLRPGGDRGRVEQLVLAAVDPRDHARKGGGGPPLEVVVAQRQLVHAVQQDAEPVGRRRERDERVDRRLERLTAQQPPREARPGVDRQLGKRPRAKRLLELGPQRARGALGGDEHGDRVSRDAVVHERHEAGDEGRGLAGPGAAEQDEWATAVCGGLALGIGQLVHADLVLRR